MMNCREILFLVLIPTIFMRCVISLNANDNVGLIMEIIMHR
jgi:hypothetical protein